MAFYQVTDPELLQKVSEILSSEYKNIHLDSDEQE